MTAANMLHTYTGVSTPPGRQRQSATWALYSGVSLDNLTAVNKRSTWSYLRHVWSGPDFSSLGLIAELLCVKHQYIELPRFHVDELDKLIEFLCCN